MVAYSAHINFRAELVKSIKKHIRGWSGRSIFVCAEKKEERYSNAMDSQQHESCKAHFHFKMTGKLFKNRADV